jgi:hypothetical protein
MFDNDIIKWDFVETKRNVRRTNMYMIYFNSDLEFSKPDFIHIIDGPFQGYWMTEAIKGLRFTEKRVKIIRFM